MKIKNYKKRVLVVAHDAGGAEIVSAYVKKNQKKFQFFCFAVGPAKNIFKKRRLKNYMQNEQTISAKQILDSVVGIDLVLTATSWSSDIENECVCESAKRGILSVSYLDHWSNYRERFGYPNDGWQKNLPTNIWVGDKEAFVLAKNLRLPRVQLVRNEYFAELQKKVSAVSRKVKKTRVILFVSEPVTVGAKKAFGNPRYWGFTEQEVLTMVCDGVDTYNQNHRKQWKIIIRRHPSDTLTTYDTVVSAYGQKITLQYSTNPSLLSDITQSDLVVGMESMALVIGLLAKKQVVSLIPSAKKKCCLPFKKIVRLTSTKAFSKVLSGAK